MIKIYADRNVDIKRAKSLIYNNSNNENIEFIQWPLEGKNRRVPKYGLPAGEISWNDLKYLTWDEMDFCSWNDFIPTDKYEKIRKIVGNENKNDCDHFDIAVKNNCLFFFTSDNHFLSKRNELYCLTGIRVFDPTNQLDLEQFLRNISL